MEMAPKSIPFHLYLYAVTLLTAVLRSFPKIDLFMLPFRSILAPSWIPLASFGSLWLWLPFCPLGLRFAHPGNPFSDLGGGPLGVPWVHFLYISIFNEKFAQHHMC